MKLYYSRNQQRPQQTLADVMAGMLGAAEKKRMPKRFTAVPNPDSPSMIITDVFTGRASDVPLHAYGEVRKVLEDLFG